MRRILFVLSVTTMMSAMVTPALADPEGYQAGGGGSRDVSGSPYTATGGGGGLSGYDETGQFTFSGAAAVS
jgi:hypothetical protein